MSAIVERFADAAGRVFELTRGSGGGYYIVASPRGYEGWDYVRTDGTVGPIGIQGYSAVNAIYETEQDARAMLASVLNPLPPEDW